MSSFVIDTSALIAIVAGEPEALPFSDMVINATEVLISAATVHEANCVITSYGTDV